jgi:hypothetical protein
MKKAILVSGDLMFISKVKEVARASGGEVTVARSEAALEKAQRDCPDVTALLIDLEKSGIPLEALSPRVATLSQQGWRIVSFFSHVHEELAHRALELGLGEVVPRSKFVKLLPDVFLG